MTKRCVICKAVNPDPLLPACGYDHIAEYMKTDKFKSRVKKEQAKADKRRHQQRKEKVRGYGYWATETQKVVNKYIRLRDQDRSCVSCGVHDWELRDSTRGKWHAGHFLAVGSAPELRFNTLNINRQCAECNLHKSSNRAGYEEGIVARFGQERLDWLLGTHEAKHYTIEDLKKMRRIFNKKIRNLEKRLSFA